MAEEIELPKELFESFGQNRIYRFIDLKGEEKEITLGENDYLSHIKCPIDGTNYVMLDDHVYEHNPHCYCCGGQYLAQMFKAKVQKTG